MGSFNRDGRGRGRSFGGRDFGSRGFDRGGSRGGERPKFKATCSNCKRECEVPFRPTNGKPVYCSDCFEKVKGGRSDSSRPERSDFKTQASVPNQNSVQFEALNAKLDRIISLLEPKKIEAVMPNLIIEEVKKAKAPKTKKAVKKLASTKKK